MGCFYIYQHTYTDKQICFFVTAVFFFGKIFFLLHLYVSILTFLFCLQHSDKHSHNTSVTQTNLVLGQSMLFFQTDLFGCGCNEPRFPTHRIHVFFLSWFCVFTLIFFICKSNKSQTQTHT